MLELYVRIRDPIKKFNPVEDLVSSAAAQIKLVAQHDHIERLNSIWEALQANSTSVADVRTLFDSIAHGYPALYGSLKHDACGVHAPLFESALTKLCRSEQLCSNG